MAYISRDPEGHFNIIEGTKCIKIASNHEQYTPEMRDYFDYYFNSVEPTLVTDNNVDWQMVYFHKPAWHKVTGFDLHKIKFPTMSEPLASSDLYLDFAQLREGQTVLDLGGYAGLTSILFKELVGPAGTVITVEPDPSNLECIKENFNLYKETTGNDISLIEAAIWTHNNGISFSQESNMGSGAVEFIGHRGHVLEVASMTLSKLAEVTNAENIDFIKADIETSERVIFQDDKFFAKFKPRIIIESHHTYPGNINDKEECMFHLEKYGYTCTKIAQPPLPNSLITCVPPQ